MSVSQLLAPARSAFRVIWPKPWSASKLLTPLGEAVEELERRRKDTVLMQKIEEYLEGDVPPHFAGGPILYLARHVATPNFETLRFFHLVEATGLPTVIGQDLKDKFVPKNSLKKALGKLPISTSVTMRGGQCRETYERLSIIDFNSSSGKPFEEIRTHWGEPLSDFHASLFKELTKHPVAIANEADWIDRQHRGNLLTHYKKFLALFIAHGILFEDYALNDREEARFIERVLRPAYRFVERKFGCRPLIAQLTPTTGESAEFWISYPQKVRDIVHERLATPSL